MEALRVEKLRPLEQWKIDSPLKTRRAIIRGAATSPAPVSSKILRNSVVTPPRPKTSPRSNEVTIQKPAVEDVHAFWDYQKIFGSQRVEVTDPVRLRVVEGMIPDDLRGSYYLCGPGLRYDDHGSCVSPLDGHGYLRKFQFGDAASVEYSARYVRTDAMKEEFEEKSRSWRFQYRGPFSLLKNGHRVGNFKVMKNVANTSVLKWGGKLLCLWEGGEPYEIDENTLETVGIFRLPLGQSETDARLHRSVVLNACTRALLPILTGGFNMPKERVLAHFKIDEKRNRLVVITSNAEDMLVPKATFTAYEFDADFKLIQRKKFFLHDQLMIHDWALTDEHYVILGNRITLDVGSSLAAMAGLSPMISCLAANKSTSYSPLYMLPRFNENKDRDWTVPAKIPGQLWVTHIANAFEETVQGGHKTRFVVDACLSSYNWFSLSSIFGYKWQQQYMDPNCMNNASSIVPGQLHSPRMHRVTVDVSNLDHSILRQTSERFSNANFASDFPVLNSTRSGAENKFTYVTSNSGRRKALSSFPMDSITKLHGPSGRASSWWAGERCYVGEPQFVRRKQTQVDQEEDDGYLIFVQYSLVDEKRYLVILDAQHIGGRRELVAKLEVPKELSFPFGFHGFWQDS